MTLNGATYYIDTTVSEAEQRKSAKSRNVFKGGETYYVFFIYSKESTKQTYQIYVGKNGFNKETDVSFVRATLKKPIIFTPETGLPAGWVVNYVSGTGILTVTADMSSFANEFAETKKDFCQPESFCQLSKNGSNQCECLETLTGDQKTQCESGDICGRWAGKDIDCPMGGCPGFSFKLPAGFVPDDKGSILQGRGGHRPEPMCFPKKDDGRRPSQWDIQLTRAKDVAGSCITTPIDQSKFCVDSDSPTPTPAPTPTPPPSGGSMGHDGEGDW